MLAAGVGIALLYRRFYVTYDDDGGEKTLRNRNAAIRYSVDRLDQRELILDNRIDTVLVGFFLNPVAVSYYVLNKQISEFVLVSRRLAGLLRLADIRRTEGQRRRARGGGADLRVDAAVRPPPLHPGGRRADPRRRSGIRLVFGADYAGAVPVLPADGDLRHLPGDHQRDDQRAGLPRPGVRPRDREGSYLRRQRRPQRALDPAIRRRRAAFATVITYGIYTAVNVFVMYREIAFNYGGVGRSVALISLISAGMGVAVLVFVPYVSNLIALAGVIALGVGIWGA